MVPSPASSAGATPPDADRFEWRWAADSNPVIRGLFYVLAGVTGALLAFVGFLLVTLASGDSSTATAAALALLVAGALALRPVIAAMSVDAGEVTNPIRTFARTASPLVLLVAVVVVAGFLWFVARVAGDLLFGTFLFLSLGPLVLVSLFRTEGSLDTARGTLVCDDRELPLDAIAGIRYRAAGDYAVCWLSYRDDADVGHSPPRLVALPARVAETLARRDR